MPKNNRDIHNKVETERESLFEQVFRRPLTSGNEQTAVTFDDLDELKQELKNNIEDTRSSVTADYISVLGIFASIVAFLLIEVQIIKSVCDFNRVLGLSLVLGGLLALFVLLLDYTVNSRREKRATFKFIAVSLLSIFLISVGGYFTNSAKDEDVCKLTSLNEEFSRLKDRFENEELKKYEPFESRLNELEQKINNLKKE